MKEQVQKADGKLGILIPGLGAVATTMIAGVEAVKKGLAQPVGSLTQTGNIRLGKRTENRFPKVKDFVPLAGLNDIVFGGWDVYEDNVYQAAIHAKVLETSLLEPIKAELEKIKPMKAVFDKDYVKNLDGTNVKEAATKYALALAVMDDIDTFQKVNGVSRMVMVWCGSTEKYIQEADVHQNIYTFEDGLRNNDPLISPSMI